MSAFHVHVPPNRFGRDFVIGDLHGMTVELQRALDTARFIPGRDRLFSVGDLVDRGPDSPGAAALIEKRWFQAVRGNHEDMLLRVLAGEESEMLPMWRNNGGAWGLAGDTPNEAARKAAALCARLPYALTLHHRNGRRFGICHAQCPVNDWSAIASVQDHAGMRREMLWARDRVRDGHAAIVAGVDFTIHGHTQVAAPTRIGNALFIETGVYRAEGRLTLLCLDDDPALNS
jgi:serine/threonine protein phosphatase 1